MKRFYREVAVGQADGGWRVLLDGRPVRSAAGRAQIVPARALAEALSAEWAAQGETIDPARFMLRDLADYAIDVVAQDRAATSRGLLAFAETDTLCYRADRDEPLWRRQMEVWDPLLGAIETRHVIRFERICGIIHCQQPPSTLARLDEILAATDDFTLAALTTLASLAASLVIALAASVPGADIAELWASANLEEAWQADLWGRDQEATARQEHRGIIFAAAADFIGLL